MMRIIIVWYAATSCCESVQLRAPRPRPAPLNCMAFPHTMRAPRAPPDFRTARYVMIIPSGVVRRGAGGGRRPPGASVPGSPYSRIRIPIRDPMVVLVQFSVFCVLVIHGATASLSVEPARPSTTAPPPPPAGGVAGSGRGGCAPNELLISTGSQATMNSTRAGVRSGMHAASGAVCMPYASDGDEMKHNPSINDTLSTYVSTHTWL
jgi:hypothetical protein